MNTRQKLRLYFVRYLGPIIRFKDLSIGRIKEWWHTKHPNPDEFHWSYRIDHNYVIALPNWRERRAYMTGVSRRRSDAHRQTLD